MSPSVDVNVNVFGQEVAKSVFEQIGQYIFGVGDSAEGTKTKATSAFHEIEGGATELGAHMRETFGEHIKSAIEDPIGSLKSFGTGIKDYVVSALESIGPEAAAAASGLALIVGVAVGVGAATFEVAEKAASAGGAIHDFSEKTGIAVENLGPLDFAAKAAGGSLQDFDGIIKQLQVRQATDDSGKFAAALKDIGINAADFKKMDSEQQLLAVAHGFQEGAKSGNDMADAVALMGRSGAEHIPLLNKLTDDLLDKGQKLGVQWTTENTEAAEKFELSLGVMHTALGAIETKIGAALLPAFASMFEDLASSPTFFNVITGGTNLLAHGLGYLVEGSGYVVTGLFALGAAAINVAGHVVNFALSIDQGLQTVFSTLAKIPGLGTEFGGYAQNTAREISGLQAVLGGLTTAYDKTVNAGGAVYDTTQQMGQALLAVDTTLQAVSSTEEVHNKQLNQTTELTKAQQEALKKHEEAIRQVHSASQDLDASTQAQILSLKDQQVGESTIAEYLGVTETQVRKVIDAQKDRETQDKRTLAEAIKDADAEQKAKEKAMEAGRKVVQQYGDDYAQLQDDIARASETGTQKQIGDITRAEQAEIQSLRKRYQEAQIDTSQMEALVTQKYQHERDLANSTASTIVERMKSQGLQTRAELQTTADAAERDYTQMKTSGQFSAQDVQAAWKRFTDAQNLAEDGWVVHSSVTWASITADAKTKVHDLTDKVAEDFTGMLTGATGFRDGMGQIWNDIKSTAISIFGEIAQAFIKDALGGMLNAILGQRGNFASAFASLMPGGGGGYGGMVGSLLGAGGWGGGTAAAGMGGGFAALGAAGTPAEIAAMSANGTLAGGTLATGGLAAGLGTAAAIGGGVAGVLLLGAALNGTGVFGEKSTGTGYEQVAPNDPYGYQNSAMSAADVENALSTARSGWQMGDGGVVMPRPGGTRATLGEAGRPEAVIPLDDVKPKSMFGSPASGAGSFVAQLVFDSVVFGQVVMKKVKSAAVNGDLQIPARAVMVNGLV